MKICQFRGYGMRWMDTLKHSIIKKGINAKVFTHLMSLFLENGRIEIMSTEVEK
jgi:hypothetical protein